MLAIWKAWEVKIRSPLMLFFLLPSSFFFPFEREGNLNEEEEEMGKWITGVAELVIPE